ncbi:MAG: cytochrome c oxidase subunit 3 family protein [Acidobacteria bacterium]|nr:cytochrome c oxidase subunit 3 family protein [Acidobacteriota bacterium]
MEQQKEASTLGMWTFLLTEVLFFGGLFFAYLLYRVWYFDAFAEASRTLDMTLGAFNTAVLIGSSLTMALAVRAAQTNQRKATVNWIILTMILGAVFLGVKVVEYADKFEHHHVPGASYIWAAEHAPAAGEAAAVPATGAADHGAAGDHAAPPRDDLQRLTQIFFSLYFTMTGLHALHMIIGMGLLGTIAWMASKGKFDEKYYTPVEMAGLYWHFVDLVWIYLFPLLYLVERHN